MKKTVQYGILFGLAWILIKIVFHAIQDNGSNVTPVIFINMFLLLVAIAFGLFQHKKKEGYTSGNALSDIKSAMTVAIPYSVIVSLFLFIYYNNINPSYNQLKIKEADMTIDKDVDNPLILQKMKNDNEAFEVMSKEKIRKELKKGPRNFYNAKSTSLISLLALMMLSTIYSIFITIVYRKVMFRGLE